MILLALASIAAVVLASLASFTALRWQARSFDRRESTYLTTIRDLNDRLMFLCERPWDTPAYVRRETERDDEELTILARRGIIRDPENIGDLDTYMNAANGSRMIGAVELS